MIEIMNNRTELVVAFIQSTMNLTTTSESEIDRPHITIDDTNQSYTTSDDGVNQQTTIKPPLPFQADELPNGSSSGMKTTSSPVKIGEYIYLILSYT